MIIRTKAGRKGAVNDKVGLRTSHYQMHGLIEAVTARLSAREIAELANDPDVESVSVDADVSALGAANTENGKKKGGASTPTGSGSDTYSNHVIGDVKRGLGLGNWWSGSGTTVAIIDSGIAPGLDFDTRIVAQYVFSNGRPAAYSLPFDDYGHGTHVAGLIGSSGASSNNKYAGIAPGVKLLSLKVLDRKGSGKTSDVINALEFAVANKGRFGIKVVNLSLGHPIYESAQTDPLVQSVEAAVRAGIVVVVAAGNYGSNTVTGRTGYAGITSPGNAPSALTVGAAVTNNTVSRADDRLADYSSRGPSWYDGIAKPDVLAPGQNLVSNDAIGSTLDRNYPRLVLGAGSVKFLRLSGSSMATGVVSGLAALMVEAHTLGAQQRWQVEQHSLHRNLRTSFAAPPALTSNAVKAMLQYSATRVHDGAGRIYDPLEQGAGLVNGAGALGLAYNADTSRSAGEYWMTTDSAPFTNFAGVNEAWSQTVIWGTRLVRGSSVIDLNQLAWADNIVWGSGELDHVVWGTFASEDNIVWGTSLSLTTDLTWAGNAALEDNIVWGTGLAWAANIVWGQNLVGFFNGQAVVWGTSSNEDNIVWGTLSEDNIVWGTLSEDNIVWGTSANKVGVLGTMVGDGL